MMDIEKLLNYLERKTADTHELQAASAIIGLRQRVQELQADLELAKHNNEAHDRELERVIAERDELQGANKLLCEDLVERHDRIAGLAAERDKVHQYWQIAEGRCDALMKQRDELVKALKEAVNKIEELAGGLKWSSGRRLIASVKEKA